MFYNKTKATWKKAFQIREEEKALFQYIKMIKEAQEAIKRFKTEDHCRKYAYKLAELNNFQGSSEFYWDTAKNILNIVCMGLEAQMADNEQSVFRLKWCYRFQRDRS